MRRPFGSRRQHTRKRLDWQVVRRAFPHAVALARPHWYLWGMGLLFMLGSRLSGLVLPAAPKFLLDEIIPNQDVAAFRMMLAVVLIAGLVQGAFSFALTQVISKAGQRLIADMRLRLQDHVLRLPTSYFDNHKAGEVSSRVMDDVEGLRNLLGTGLVEFLSGIITATLTIGILFWLNWQLTIAVMVTIVIFLVILIRSFMILGPLFRERQEHRGNLAGRLVETVGGIRVVKAYHTEEKERQVFRDGINSLLQTIFRTITTVGFVAFLISATLGVLGAVIFHVGGSQIMAGELTAGEFFSFVAFLAFMIAPVSSIMMIGPQFSEAFAGIDRMNEILALPTEDAGEGAKATLAPIRGHVQFDQVSFAYVPGVPVLRSVSFEAPPGTVTAVVGPSGSGKSTLIGLVASFHGPNEGRILVDDQSLADIRLADYRSQLGVVLQDNFLFAGTIRENLLYARPDATPDQLQDATRLAHCLEFIDGFPDGMDSVIGERGIKLSGGQRQRLAIARAILADPRILILDEATSALDSESEAAIQEGLKHLMAGRTTFVIAHRLSTIRHADQILVLEGGAIVERGPHRELLAARGRYYDMYTRQYGVERNLFLAPGEVPTDPDAEETPEGEDDATAAPPAPTGRSLP